MQQLSLLNKSSEVISKNKSSSFFKPFIQPKLNINQPNDVYEQEADAMADKVMRMSDASINSNSFFKPAISSVQRKCAHCAEQEQQMQQKENNADASVTLTQNYTPETSEFEENPVADDGGSITVDMNLPLPAGSINSQQPYEEMNSPSPTGLKVQRCAACEEESKKMQRKETAGKSTETEPDISITKQTGESLQPAVRSFFEPRFGYGFDQVKIYKDDKAAESASSINARAYTYGDKIVFGKGEYSPETNTGRQLIAHELTHVIQQNASKISRLTPVSNTSLTLNHSVQPSVQRWHVGGASDRSLNTIVCDGSGGIRVQLGGTGNADETTCLSDCMRQHEGSHRSDALAANANLCRDKGNGSQVLMDGRAEQQASEIAASNVEITCLRGKLPAANATCRPIITSRITQMETYRDSFR